MNERIKELAEQAGFDPDAIKRMGVMPNAEKFAELLIKECVTVLNKEMTRLDSLNRNVSAQTLDTAQLLVLKHFGIKE